MEACRRTSATGHSGSVFRVKSRKSARPVNRCEGWRARASRAGRFCGQCEQCVAGRDNFCADYALFGRQIHGGYAEFVRSPSVNVILIPGNSHRGSCRDSARPLTAWHMLFTRAQLRPSEEVLAIAAGSGVGSAAIQIAKATGARVIATAGPSRSLRKRGAWRRRNSAAYGRIRARGGASDRRARRGRRLRARRPGHLGTERVQSQAGGRPVTCGATTGRRGSSILSISSRGSFDSRSSWAEVSSSFRAEPFQRGLLKPVVDTVMPLDRAADAHRRLENREQFGKVVLTIP